MECPNCKTNLAESDYQCKLCNYGVRSRPKRKSTAPRYIGDKTGETHDEKLARTYQCTSCRSHGGKVKRIAATGGGISRLLDWQINEFIIASCNFCGLVQMFDPDVIDKSATGWKIIDFLIDF
jgi:uncharacterized protein